MKTWLAAHWQTIATVLGVYAAIATIAVRKITRPVAPPSSKIVVVLYHVFIDLPAALPGVDFKGMFGLPFNVPFVTLSLTPKTADSTDVTPKPPSAPPVTAFLPFLVFLSLMGCSSVMNTYQNAIGTAAGSVTTGYKLLDQWDRVEQAKITTLAKTDPNNASGQLQDHNRKYETAHKALDDAAIVVESARAATATVQAATDRDKQVSGWVMRLATFASNLIAILQQNGVM